MGDWTSLAKPRSACTWLALALICALALGACKVSPRTLEKWRNRPGSEELFVQWMLSPEATAEVRQKAIEMLFEQYDYEGAEQLPRVADLPQEQRDQAIMDALPRIIELYEGAEFTLGGDDLFKLDPVKVRDAVFILLDTTETPATRDELMAIITRWLNEEYNPCVLSTGRKSAAGVLSAVGVERGLPVVTRFIQEESFEYMLCQSTSMADISWLAEVADQVAEAYINRWESRRPQALENQLVMSYAMLTVPESRSLKTWVFVNHLTNTASEIMQVSPDAVMAFIDYVRPLSTTDDIRYYEQVLQRREGNLRWMAFEDIVALGGPEGLGRALDAIPDAGVWSRWGGEIREDGLSRAATYLCGRPVHGIPAEGARAVLEARLEAPNLVARAIAIRCLGEIGNDATIALLQGQSETTTLVPAWGTDEESAISAIAAVAIERIQTGAQQPEQPPEEEGTN